MDKSIESNNSMLSPNFEIPCEIAEEEVEEEIPDEISRLLKHEERIIQPHKEPLEAINLGSKEDKKEVNIGASLDIKRFLQIREYPLGASYKDKKTLRRLSRNFFLNEDVLYKRNLDMVLLRCVDRHEADTIIHEMHEGSFGTHSNGHAMSRKILRSGYYWITMESDCCKHVKRCHKCQIYADKIHVPPTPLNVL